MSRAAARPRQGVASQRTARPAPSGVPSRPVLPNAANFKKEFKCYYEVSWPPQEYLCFFWPRFVTRLLTPLSRKSGYGLLLGCRSSLDSGSDKTSLFWRCSKREQAKNREIYIVCSDPRSQSIGRGRISREGALDVRESRERCDKIVPKVSPENRKKRNFGLNFSAILSRIACCSRESRSA